VHIDDIGVIHFENDLFVLFMSLDFDLISEFDNRFEMRIVLLLLRERCTDQSLVEKKKTIQADEPLFKWPLHQI